MLPKKPYKILLMAGEPSGDALGAALAKAIHNANPDIQLSGMGGHQMRAAGVDILVNSDELAIIGVLEVLKHLGHLSRIKKQLKQYFSEQKPDLVIFIDYPGFNLHMAKHAKKADLKVLFYVSPQIWAWRYGRIKKIRKSIDRMAVLFQFEEKIYQKENIPVSFVGHPLVEKIIPTLTKEQAYEQFNLSPNQPIVGLFPGSRHQEISRLLPAMIETVKLLKTEMPEVQWVLPLASNLSLDDIKNYLIPEIKVIQNNTYNFMPLCHAAIAASGTVTLEIGLNQIPLTIIYKVTKFSYWLGKTLLYIPYIGLCNIVAEERIAQEFIQDAVIPEKIAAEVKRLLLDNPYRQNIIEKLGKVKASLGEKGCSFKVAQVALAMLPKHNDNKSHTNHSTSADNNTAATPV